MRKLGFFRALYFSFCFILISAVLISISVLTSKFFPMGEIQADAQAPVPVIIIDAGHGGRDAGASADDGTQEKDLNLAVALKLKSLFEMSGVKIVMTRETDIALGSENSNHKKLEDLQARVKIASEHKNAVFVSIHMNKYPVSKYSGLTIYYSKTAKGSERFASAVQSTVKTYLQPSNTRECKGAGDEIYVLGNAPCPAILVECGFLSNAEELSRLCDGKYQMKVALCIFSAVMNALYENQAI